MTRIDSMSNLPGGGLNEPGAGLQGQPQASGTLQGQVIVPTTAESVLTDAAEEITMAHSEKAEEKGIEKRKLDAATHAQLIRIEDIHKLLEEAHAQKDQATMLALAKRLLAQSGNQARQEARDAFQEPVKQYLGLQYALDYATQAGADEATLHNLQDALEELMLDAGPRIHAGLNSMQALGQATQSAEQVEAIQATYTDMVLGRATLADTLSGLLEQFNERDFAKGLAGMIRALGDDLSATRPSTEPARLQSLVSDLYQLEVTHTLLERCHEVSVVLQREHGKPPLDASQMLQKVIGLTTERWINANAFTRLAEGAGCADFSSQIRFLTEMKGVLRDLPVKIFADADSRQSMIIALQDALDVAIDREEEQL